MVQYILHMYMIYNLIYSTHTYTNTYTYTYTYICIHMHIQLYLRSLIWSHSQASSMHKETLRHFPAICTPGPLGTRTPRSSSPCAQVHSAPLVHVPCVARNAGQYNSVHPVFPKVISQAVRNILNTISFAKKKRVVTVVSEYLQIKVDSPALLRTCSQNLQMVRFTMGVLPVLPPMGANPQPV